MTLVATSNAQEILRGYSAYGINKYGCYQKYNTHEERMSSLKWFREKENKKAK